MTSGWQTPNPFLDNDINRSFNTQFSQFKPLPLPDDLFGFDVSENPLKPNAASNLDFSTLKHQNERNSDEDFGDILFDLGISEQPNLSTIDPHSLQKRGHKRQLSGSEIFGYIGNGDNTQLAIPGLPAVNVNISEKKSIYNEFDYTGEPVIKPEDLFIEPITHDVLEKALSTPILTNQEKPHYHVSSGNPKSYKFPPPPSTPKLKAAKLNNKKTVKPISSIEDLGRELSNFSNKKEAKEIDFISPIRTPLKGLATSSPFKPESIRKFDFGTPKKDSDDTDKTISQFATPLKVKNAFPNMQTPSPQKTPTKISWFPTLITKKNSITDEIIKQQKKSPTRKKKPTITSTLATGTLDEYFVGPLENDKKFVCKFQHENKREPCNRAFNRISNVRAHVQTHLCDRPFVCEICSKSFVRNHDLRRHAKGHSDFEYFCPCGKKFPRHDAMKRHRMRNICIGGYKDGTDKDKESEVKPKSPGSIDDNKIEPPAIKKAAKAAHNIGKVVKPDQKIKSTVQANDHIIQNLEINHPQIANSMYRQTDMFDRQQKLMMLKQQQQILENEIQMEQQQLRGVSAINKMGSKIQPRHQTMSQIPNNGTNNINNINMIYPMYQQVPVHSIQQIPPYSAFDMEKYQDISLFDVGPGDLMLDE